jgi:hypothetical protein
MAKNNLCEDNELVAGCEDEEMVAYRKKALNVITFRIGEHPTNCVFKKTGQYFGNYTVYRIL